MTVRACDAPGMRPVLVLAAVVLAACGGSRAPAPARVEPIVTPAPPVAVPPPADPYRDALNLDFERSAGALPAGWKAGAGPGAGAPPGYELTVATEAHHGGASLRVRATPGGGFAAAATTLDATPLRGQRVRLSGWIKTDGLAAADSAALWLRVDGGQEGAFDNMAGRGLTGTASWRAAAVTVDVPADGVTLVLGPLLVGSGTAWFDDLTLEVTAIPPPREVALAGVVVDPAGQPAAGAVVALVSPRGRVTARATTDAAGHFRFTAAAGAWGVSAHHPSGDGAFFDPRQFDEDTGDLRLVVTTGDGVRVRGTVVAAEPLPAGTFVEVSPYSNHGADIFTIPVGADGRFEARLPRGASYHAALNVDGLLGAADGERAGD